MDNKPTNESRREQEEVNLGDQRRERSKIQEIYVAFFSFQDLPLDGYLRQPSFILVPILRRVEFYDGVSCRCSSIFVVSGIQIPIDWRFDMPDTRATSRWEHRHPLLQKIQSQISSNHQKSRATLSVRDP